MTKEQWSKIVSILIMAAIAIATVLGFNITVVQPGFSALEAQLPATVDEQLQGLAGSRAVGVDSYVEALWVDKEFTSAGATTLTGPLQGASALTLEGATADAYETTVAVTDPTADRTFTLPNLSGTALLTNTPKVVAFGTNTITGTLTLSHGLTNVTQVFCSLTQDSEADAATCSATISGGTAVVKTWKADGVTAGSVGKQVAWMVVGTP